MFCGGMPSDETDQQEEKATSACLVPTSKEEQETRTEDAFVVRDRKTFKGGTRKVVRDRTLPAGKRTPVSTPTLCRQ